MKKFLQKKLKDQKGMTLIELLAVIVIIAIIAAIAIPAISTLIENSRYGAAKADLQNAISSAQLYIAEEGQDPASVADLADEYMSDTGTLVPADVTFDRDANDVLTIEGNFTIGSDTMSIGATTNSTLSGYTSAEFKDATTAVTP